MCSTRKNLRSILLVIIGSGILAFGSYNFNYQNGVTEGGVLGLILLVKNVFDISPSITNLIIDFSLFALGARFFGKRFLLCSIFATVCFSTSYGIFERMGFVVPNLNEHMLFASMFAGIFVGIGAGLVLRGGGASGGDDVIALLGNKFTPLKVNHVYLLSDAIILIISLVYLDVIQVMFSIVAVLISGKLIGIIYEYKNDDIQDNSVEDKGTEEAENNEDIKGDSLTV
ncbi:YitT family protein [Clostridium sardiniense]|uniref:YitT family protein n=1 Tax=Clostridium sardiniense TaxID=29369 RepID=UPI00195A4812|nr:YitT family protein [Clostridium sardiniense]MBM7833120.1 uncharacterized membrane-anchored protein YitT (DUF2179 family) [Clostridium sardiniense]